MSLRLLNLLKDLLQFFFPDPVLIQLRQDGLQLIQTSGPVQNPGQQRKTGRLPGCDQPQQKALPGLGKNRPLLHPGLFKYPVSQPGKAEDIDIQDSVHRTELHQLFLRLHGKLFRYQYDITPVRMLPRLPKSRLEQETALACAGRPQYESQRHIASS